ncbi:hypothetical protein JCM10908_005875 [Rhodotorula pacifica]|uniref:uncharacterized protein n=1 Tax=Rhodotorula pacifica TaxID=1495444 RepID=UPI00317726CC
MSLRESRSRIVTSLWDCVFRSDFDAIKRMFAPGFTYEVSPAPKIVLGVQNDANLPYGYLLRTLYEQIWPEAYRIMVSDVPRTDNDWPGHELLHYLQQLRAKVLVEQTEMNVTEQSMGENSLQTRFVTKGRDARGEPYDIKHSLFLEFAEGDKIKRGVEYIESDALMSYLKREQGSKDWQPLEAAANKSVEGQPQQAQVEGAQAKGESSTAAAASEGGDPCCCS